MQPLGYRLTIVCGKAAGMSSTKDKKNAPQKQIGERLPWGWYSILLVALLVEGGGILPPAPNRVAGLLVLLAGGGINGRLDLGIL